jgi:hypothetical protein
MNCLGNVSRDSGQSRVPAPPAMTSGTIFGTDIKRALLRQVVTLLPYSNVTTIG